MEVSEIYTRLKEMKESVDKDEAMVMDFRGRRLALFLGDSDITPNVKVVLYSEPGVPLVFNVDESGEMHGESSHINMPFNHGEYEALVDTILKEGKVEKTSHTRKSLDDLFENN